MSKAVERFVRAWGWPAGGNRDEVIRRIDAWDAQVAAVKELHKGKLGNQPFVQSERQQLLPFNASLTSTSPNRRA